MDFAIPEATQTVTPRDAILYALSTGYGTEPFDPAHLAYIYERSLIPAPTLANIAASPGPWMRRTGVDWAHVVHAEQRLTLHRSVPIGVPLVSRSRPVAVVDRGVGKGMFASFERTLYAATEPAPVATVVQTIACRRDGGCGSLGPAPEPLARPPSTAPDAVFRIETARDAAALYRLNGDLNDIHIDPAAAREAGYATPLLHGLCTFGYAAYAISRSMATRGLADIGAIAARFSAPVFPGEALEFHLWRAGDEVRFRGLVPARDAVVLDCGVATLNPTI